MTARTTSTKPTEPRRRMAISLSLLAGIGYAAAWIISLSVGAPNPSVAAPASKWRPGSPGTAVRPWPCSPSPRASPPSPWSP